ncbi:hypothetical protein KSS87_002204 [Heliosperma pusillum]|nr:hypothetical protein KSS87_002204 [Heliosperma pusillum]
MNLSSSPSTFSASTPAATADPSSSSSSSSAATTTSWFSGIVRGRSSKNLTPRTRSAPSSLSAAAATATASASSSIGPVVKKNQLRGLLFRYGPKSIQVAFKTGDFNQQGVLGGDGGLADDKRQCDWRWRAAAIRGFGGGRKRGSDALEIDQLISYLINKENSDGVILLGHSTGCQDIVHYMRTNAACSRAVRAAILQAMVDAWTVAAAGGSGGGQWWAPVSDREYLATLPETAAMIDLASKMISEGKASDLMPREAKEDAPITAYRYHSLCAYMGDDDMFSSDLSDDQLKTRLGHMSNIPCQVIYSMGDEYVPEYVDKKALVERLCRALGGAEKVEIEYGNHSLSNRVAEAVQAIMDFVRRETPKGWDDPWS